MIKHSTMKQNFYCVTALYVKHKNTLQ